MQLHDLGLKSKKKKRIGRGGKRGTMSGRGMKGQKSRAGHKIRPALRELIERIPKHRGFKNKIKGPKAFPLNLSILNREVEDGASISIAMLKKEGLVNRRFMGPVKILGNGEIKKKLTIEAGIKVSETAKEKITKAGGTIQ